MARTETKISLIGLSKRAKAEAWIFLLIWPWLNISIISVALNFMGRLNPLFFLQVTWKMWGVFIISYCLFSLVEFLLKRPLTHLFGNYVWLFRPIVIVLIFIGFAPIVDISVQPDAPSAKVIPLMTLLLEIFVYSAVMIILQQQDNYYHSRLNAQQAELQALKMQSNPHFLFNTLNLIATEVTRHPLKAKELIYNLSDLLRDTVKLANRHWVTLEEELQLVELYLLLQQKRFADRFTFDLDCPAELYSQPIPSLLLLPVVENAIKYGVAPYAKSAHVSVNVELERGFVEIEVQDTGALFDDSSIEQGEGLRILTDTLRLHFGNDFSTQLTSTVEGSSMRIRFPQVNSHQTTVKSELFK